MFFYGSFPGGAKMRVTRKPHKNASLLKFFNMNLQIQLKNQEVFPEIGKQIVFVTARALTWTADDVRMDIREGIKDQFKVRNRWTEQGNKYGIKFKPATKKDLTATVYTRADWLVDHEKGATRKAERSKYRAIPTEEVRRSKKDIIRKNQRPRNLKRSFVVKTGSEALFMQRKGKGKRSTTRVMYVMNREVKIEKNAVFATIAPKSAVKHFNRQLLQSVSVLKMWG